MKRFSLLMLIAFVACSMHAELPEWYAQVDGLLDGVEGIADSLQVDIDHYVALESSLDALSAEFDESAQNRGDFLDWLSGLFDQSSSDFEAIEAELANKDAEIIYLQDQLAMLNGQADADLANIAVLQAEIANKDIEVADLQAQLDALSQQTAAEIAALNVTIAQLNDELNASRQAYVTLVDMNEDRAQEVIETLTELKQKHIAMVDQRAMFLASVDRLRNKIGGHFMAEDIEVQDFMNTYSISMPTDEPAQDPVVEESVIDEPAQDPVVEESSVDAPIEDPADDGVAEPVDEPAAQESAVDAPAESAVDEPEADVII